MQFCRPVFRRMFGVAFSSKRKTGGNRRLKFRKFGQSQKFIDRVKITATAGDGGMGSNSFNQSRGSFKKKADGGHGGVGGSVYIKATESSTLSLSSKHVHASKGTNGKSQRRRGRNGEDAVVIVPVGTVVRRLKQYKRVEADIIDENFDWQAYIDAEDDFDCEEEDQEPVVLADLNQPGESVLVAQGGMGGRGNKGLHPLRLKERAADGRQHQAGGYGEKVDIELVLKLVADVGLVGYPNAGKSSLLRGVSRARPRVEAYPFTTVHPNIGTVQFPDYKTFSIADIPGLVDGAHANKGLGHSFLRHIERTKVLLFVLDAAGSEGRDPVQDLQNLRREIELYSPELLWRPHVVVANKIDLIPQQESLDQIIDELCGFVTGPVIPISAQKRKNLPELVNTVRQMIFSR